MVEIRIKDVIFSFRHLYLENNRKLNKRLGKHISNKSIFIDDIALYVTSNPSHKKTVNIKYTFKKGTPGDIYLRLNELINRNTELDNPASIKCNDNGEYYIDSKYNIRLKDQRIAKDMECMFKEEFYQNIQSRVSNEKMDITFSETEITYSTNDFIIWYNCLGDVILSYSGKPFSLEDALNTSVPIELLSDYHKGIIKSEKKPISSEKKEYLDTPGDYSIKERDSDYSLRLISKKKINRYI